ILPFLELLGQSMRSTGIDPDLERASVTPRDFWTLLFPFLFGKHQWPDGYWGETIFEFWLGAFYVGILPLLTVWFALSALWRAGDSEEARWHRFLVIFGLCACLVGVVLAVGMHLPVYQALVDHLPGFNKVRWPSRFMLVVIYFLPLLGGLGLHRLLGSLPGGGSRSSPPSLPSQRLAWVFFGVAVAAGLLLFAGYVSGGLGAYRFFTGDRAPVPPEARLELFGADYRRTLLFLGLFLVGFFVLLRSRGERGRPFALVLLLGGSFLNLAVVSRSIHPLSSEDVYSWEPPLWKQLDAELAHDPHWRIYTRYGLNQYNLLGVDDPNVYKMAKTVAVGETWLQSGIHRAWRSSLGIERYYDLHFNLIRAEDERIALRLVDLLNVRWVIYGPEWDELVAGFPELQPKVMVRPNALPRAFLVRQWEVPADFMGGLVRLVQPEFDIHSAIMLEPSEDGAMPAPGIMLDAVAAGGAEGVRSIEYTSKGVTIEVEAGSPALLVLCDSFFPGWHARVNGSEAPIFCANLVYRAVEIPAGVSTVEFRYVPVRWRVGMGLAGFGVLVMAGGWWKWGSAGRVDHPGSEAFPEVIGCRVRRRVKMR
ncbi:MAG: hypothetical protein ACC661_11245, partial [Verrucomicrobiales bacterium]